MNSFGNYFKDLRKQKRIGLRKFCKDAGADPGNISRMERGLVKPPNDNILKRYAATLGIMEGDSEWYNLVDLASTARGQIPLDIMKDEKITDLLPAFFRTIRGSKPSEEEMRELMNLIRSEGE